MGVICILVSIGILLQKKGVVDNLTSRKLSAIVVDVCNPALIMSSILGGEITADHHDLIVALILGAVFYAVLIVLGLIIPGLLKIPSEKKRFYHLMTVYTNTGFLGIPVAKAALPSNAIIYVIVINILYSILFYTHGLAVLGDKDDTGNGRLVSRLSKIANPGTVMAILSLVVFWFSVELPPIIANTIGYIGNATVFLSMVMLGVSIARSDIGKSIKNLKIWLFILIRMVVFPVAVALIMWRMGFDRTATLAMCLMSSVPVGNLPMIQAEKMGEDTTVLSSAIAATTAVSVVTITLILAVFSMLL